MTVQPLPMSPDWDVRSMPEALPEPHGIQGLHAVLRKAGAATLIKSSASLPDSNAGFRNCSSYAAGSSTNGFQVLLRR